MSVLKKTSAILLNRDTFKILLVVATILKGIPLLYTFVEPFFTLFLIWGLLLVVYDAFTKRLIFSNRFTRVAFAFIFIMGISTLLNFNYGLILNIKTLLYNSVALLLIFVYDRKQPLHEAEATIFRINSVFIKLTFIATLVSDVMFVFWIHSSLEVGGKTIWQGVTSDRLAGIYANPIDGAYFAVLSILFCLYNTVAKNGNLKKMSKFYIANIVLQIIFIIASDSSGPICGIIATLSMAFIFYISPSIQAKFKNMVKTTLITMLAIAFILGGTLFLNNVGKTVLSLVPSSIQYMISEVKILTSNSGDGSEPPTFNEIQIGKKYNDDNQTGELGTTNDVTSGRLYLWKATLQYSRQNLLFGVGGHLAIGPEGEITSKIDETRLDPAYAARLVRMKGSTHNIFLQVLLVYGVVGLVLFCILGFCIAFAVIKFFIQIKFCSKDYHIYSTLLLVCSFIVATNLFENYILCRQLDMEMVVFWMYAGYAIYLQQHSTQPETEELVKGDESV